MSFKIYYKRMKTEPAEIRNIRTEYGRWHLKPGKYVIHHTKLARQLFECGFLLGYNKHNQDRVTEFMRARFNKS